MNKEEQRLQRIQKLLKDGYKVEKPHSQIVINFFSLVTIILISISIILYVNYIVPVQKEKEQKELQVKKQQEYFDQRAKQIALSHKLNKKETTKPDEN